MERRRKYRLILCLILICALVALFICWMLYLWGRVPGMIHIRAGVQQQLDLNVPVSGTLYRSDADTQAQTGETAVPVSGRAVVQEEPQRSLSVDLNGPLTLYAQEPDSYTMELKLFGLIPFKTVQVEVIEDRTLIPAGIPIGIYVKTQGVLVIATGEFEGPDGQVSAPAARLLKEGDYILSSDGEAVTGKAEFMRRIAESGGKKMLLTILRDGQQFDISITPEPNRDGEYKLGIWIRVNTQGVGTLTWLDEDNSFGALGHGINDVDTGTLLQPSEGKLYDTTIINIHKGEAGTPGELSGLIRYRDSFICGTIAENTEAGIFGSASSRLIDSLGTEMLQAGYKQEIEPGKAWIRSSVSGEVKDYQVEIVEVHRNEEDVNKGIVLEVTDPELLELTGGIVQGMSGSPIIQNGKIVGAVTHVFVQDSAKGFGIFIENMLEHVDI